ncbi:ArsR/SmtB family transcription factor [Rhizobium sp. LjRoot254]|uniref:ArsR/SmtB family transcription factor n=1 Tax=Rhizobium sp. LjRoot254 TaxID=3342297 RepID=UPI003ECE5F95
MVERTQQVPLNEIFHALSDDTRRAMLRDLAKGERTVGELAKSHPMTLAAASKHIKVLEHAGLVSREVRWRTHICRLSPLPLRRALEEIAFYERFWAERLDTLERLLLEDDAAAPSNSSDSEGEST